MHTQDVILSVHLVGVANLEHSRFFLAISDSSKDLPDL